MKNPSVLGLSLLVLVAATTVVGPSSADSDRSFQSAHQTLISTISNASAEDVMASYPRQTNTISLNRGTLDQPHWLRVKVPVGTTLEGQLVINGQTQLSLTNALEAIDLSPYLTSDITNVTIEGQYSPASAPIEVMFDGPNTLIQQQPEGSGRIRYQLNLLVD